MHFLTFNLAFSCLNFEPLRRVLNKFVLCFNAKTSGLVSNRSKRCRCSWIVYWPTNCEFRSGNVLFMCCCHFNNSSFFFCFVPTGLISTQSASVCVFINWNEISVKILCVLRDFRLNARHFLQDLTTYHCWLEVKFTGSAVWEFRISMRGTRLLTHVMSYELILHVNSKFL